MRLLAVLLRAQVCAGDSWPGALDTARRLTPFYKRLYPQAGSATCCAFCSPGGRSCSIGVSCLRSDKQRQQWPTRPTLNVGCGLLIRGYQVHL